MIRPLLVATLALSGCVATVSTYSSDAERAEFERQCAELNSDHAKVAENASAIAAMAIGMGRFECERPRLWIRTEGPVAPAPEPAREIPPLPVMERTAEDEALAARHRAEAEDLRRAIQPQRRPGGGGFQVQKEQPRVPPKEPQYGGAMRPIPRPE